MPFHLFKKKKVKSSDYGGYTAGTRVCHTKTQHMTPSLWMFITHLVPQVRWKKRVRPPHFPSESPKNLTQRVTLPTFPSPFTHFFAWNGKLGLASCLGAVRIGTRWELETVQADPKEKTTASLDPVWLFSKRIQLNGWRENYFDMRTYTCI